MKTFVRRVYLLALSVLWLAFTYQGDFLTHQKKHEKVRKALNEKQSILERTLKDVDLNITQMHVLFVAYKDEDVFEVYAKKPKDTRYIKIRSYNICSRSGALGPKRQQGDGQVPEGFYSIDRFNPFSHYYLSLGIDYPNLSDKRKSSAPDLGGNIFIHGSCVTIGCLPLTDEFIKEVYVLAVHARNNGQAKIPVYIFPFKMSDENMKAYQKTYRDRKDLISFWENLKMGYDRFIDSSKALTFKISATGEYVF